MIVLESFLLAPAFAREEAGHATYCIFHLLDVIGLIADGTLLIRARRSPPSDSIVEVRALPCRAHDERARMFLERSLETKKIDLAPAHAGGQLVRRRSGQRR